MKPNNDRGAVCSQERRNRGTRRRKRRRGRSQRDGMGGEGRVRDNEMEREMVIERKERGKREGEWEYHRS